MQLNASYLVVILSNQKTHFFTDLHSVEYLSFLTFGCVPGVATISLPKEDDHNSDAINIPTGIPMGNQTHYKTYVCTLMLHTSTF